MKERKVRRASVRLGIGESELGRWTAWGRRGNERWQISCVTEELEDEWDGERRVEKLCVEGFGMDLATRPREDGLWR